MKNPLNIQDLGIWDRVLNTAEVNMLYNPDKIDYSNNDKHANHICVVTFRAKGFWNKILFKKRQAIYINGVENVSFIVKKGTISWWSK